MWFGTSLCSIRVPNSTKAKVRYPTINSSVLANDSILGSSTLVSHSMATKNNSISTTVKSRMLLQISPGVKVTDRKFLPKSGEKYISNEDIPLSEGMGLVFTLEYICMNVIWGISTCSSFDRHNKTQRRNIHKWFEALVKNGRKDGYAKHRAHVKHQELVAGM